MDIEFFKQRLIETATWCQQCSEAEHRLRSPILRPNFPQDPDAFYFLLSNNVDEEENLRRVKEGNFALFEFKGDQDQIVEDVAKRRTALLQEVATISLSSVLKEGALLAYDIGSTLYDGGSAQESNNFYDVGDTPPWATWMGYVYETERVLRWTTSYLVSWVPNAYLAMAGDGLDWSAGDCLRWLNELDTNFTRQLRAAGLLPPTNDKKGTSSGEGVPFREWSKRSNPDTPAS